MLWFLASKFDVFFPNIFIGFSNDFDRHLYLCYSSCSGFDPELILRCSEPNSLPFHTVAIPFLSN